MNALIRITTIIVVICTFFSCDDDFNSVGSEVIGGVNFEDRQYIAKPVAYSKKFDRVRTGNLAYAQNNQPVNHARLLGVYNDPVYGQTTYGILSQLIPSQFNPQFGNNPVLDSVVVSMPYISTRTETKQVDVALTQTDGSTVTVTENETVYALDSIYQSNPFKLSIYQSNYFLRDFDPATNDRQVYYSNDIESFGAEVESTLLYTNDSFVPSAKEVVTTVPDDGDTTDDNTAPDRTRIPPQLRITFKDDPAVTGNPGKVVLDSFKAQFLDKEDGIELSNQDNFNNFFRGIYLKAEAVNDSGNLLYVNSQAITFTLHYTNDGDNDSEGDPTRDEEVLTLTFGGTVVNDIRTDFKPAIAEELKSENQDKVNGEERLYLKGGDGSFAVLDMFNKYVETDADGDFILDENGAPIFIDNPTDAQKVKTELDFLRSRDWIINDASFKFYIDQDNVTAGDTEAERIYIFNLETGAILEDYRLDRDLLILVDFNNPINSIPNHLGRITRDSDDAGEFYRIRITRHIINLLNNNDLDNIKFGVCVSQNVNVVTSVIGDTSTNTDEIIPTSSIVSHEGTILFGNGAGVPEAKSLKLDIFYTESKN